MLLLTNSLVILVTVCELAELLSSARKTYYDAFRNTEFSVKAHISRAV